MAIFNLGPLLLLLGLGTAYVINSPYAAIENKTSPVTDVPSNLLRRADDDPADFTWINRWAAIGDSFTAGIGAGNPLGVILDQIFTDSNDWLCSRYDLSYPVLIDNALGPAKEEFQFKACSGDRSTGIYDQVEALNGNLNLVIMTAGGNDLCLAGMIMKCVFIPGYTEEECQTVIDKAQENIDTILKPNIKEILEALDDKMEEDSIVVYNGYAQYFDTTSDDCADNQNWAFPRWTTLIWGDGLPLTVARRESFNKLVQGINSAIKEVIDDVSENSKVKYKLAFSDWDIWPREGVDGQMCDPSSSGQYPDDSQPDLQFFKPDTSFLFAAQLQDTPERKMLERLVRRSQKESIYDTLLWKSADPAAAALHRLDPRAPSPPNCPGDDDTDWTMGMGLPDSMGKNFHPNELGHQTIAAFALDNMIDARAEVLGVASPTCEVEAVDEFTCWQDKGRRGYANPDRLNEDYKTFCDEIDPPEHTVGWKSERSFWQDTPDEHSFLFQTGEDVGEFDKDECLDSFDRIINSCDGDDPDNPMNWKFGGRYVRGEYTYEVNIKRDNRPWPPIQEAHGSCEGWYKVFYGEYKLHGAGWSTWDFGQQTVLPKTKDCLGLGVTAWKFEYYDKPDDDGMEWGASFNTPIWVRARCFNNNKVAFASGGFTDGCNGND